METPIKIDDLGVPLFLETQHIEKTMDQVAELLPISPPLLLSVAVQLRIVPVATLHYLARH